METKDGYISYNIVLTGLSDPTNEYSARAWAKYDISNSVTVNAYFYSDRSLVSGKSEGASGEIYDLIVNNGDIIKGCFAGHLHSDFYTEIDAVAADGTYTAIPQYVLKGTIYDEGNALRITVK